MFEYSQKLRKMSQTKYGGRNNNYTRFPGAARGSSSKCGVVCLDSVWPHRRLRALSAMSARFAWSQATAFVLLGLLIVAAWLLIQLNICGVRRTLV
jgi:hypothetical protein